MKIAFIGSRGVPHSYASAEQLALHLGKFLTSKGHEFTVYCHANEFKNDRSQIYEGIKRVFIPTFKHKIFGQLTHALLSSFHSAFQQYDIIHYQCLNNSFQSIIPFIFGKTIITNVDGQIWDDPKWPNYLRQIFFRSAARAAMFVSKEIITDAIGISSIYKDDYNKDSVIIEYGADIIDSCNPEVLLKYNLKPNEYYFVAARLVPSNSADLIIDAFNKSKSKRKLVIAGGHSYGSKWYSKLRSEAGERVKFIGVVSNQDEINELYCNAYAYLHGSSLGGINSALLRPLGCGIPCIALDTVYNREVLTMKDGKMFGLLWERNSESLVEQINILDSNESLAIDLRIDGQRRIKEAFIWERICRQYEIFYDGVIKGEALEKIKSKVDNV